MDKFQKLEQSCINCKLLWDTLDEKYELKEQLKCALEITSLGLWEWFLKDNKLTLSDEVFQIAGFSKDSFDGTMDYIIENIVHPDSKQLFIESILKASVEGLIPNKSYRIIHPNKTNCWIQLYSKLILDNSGNPIKVIGTLMDVTDKFDQHSNIIKSLNFLETLVETLPNPIFYKDKEGFYRYCNTSFADLIGKSKSEIIGHTVYDIADDVLAKIYHDADIELMNSSDDQNLSIVQEYEAPVKYADDSIHDIIFRKANHINSSNKVIGLVGIMEDITEKKSIENELKLFHKIKDTFISINRDILSFKNEKDFFDGIQDRLQDVFEHCDQSTVLEVNENGDLLMLTNRGYNSSEASDFSLSLEDSFIWHYTSGDLRDVRIINNIENYIEHGFTAVPTTTSNETIKSTLMLPLYIENKLKWILSFDSIENEIYSKSDVLIAKYICEELPILYRVFNIFQQNNQLSRYDSFTGLMNEYSFRHTLNETFEIAFNYHEKFTVILLELDQINYIQSRYGPDASDQYILRFSKILKSNFAHYDVIFRIGLSKFAGIFFDVDIDDLYEQINSIKLEFELSNSNIGLSDINHVFKSNISVYPDENTTDFEHILHFSDIKMDLD